MTRKLDYEYHMTLQEIADEIGVSRQCVEQIIGRALRKLRRSKLRDYAADEFLPAALLYELSQFELFEARP